MSILVIVLLILGAIGLAVMSYYMGKHEWLKPIFYSIAGIGLLGFSMFCIADLNYYYNVKGGIYGVLTGVFNTNQVEQDNLNFSLKNIELTQEFENKYSATIMINNSIEIENKYYEIFVNGIPCTYSEVDTIHATGSYGYVFYDDSMEEILSDTLNFNFAFYENYSTLKVSTNGGTEAVKNWNSYFNKNNFVVSIEESTRIDTEMNLVDGDISKFKKITYYVEDVVFHETYFDTTKEITWINKILVKEDHAFLGWSLDRKTVVENLSSKSDVKVYAILVQQEVIFSGEKLLQKGELSTSCTFDLNEYFEIYFPSKNIEVELDVLVSAEYGEQAGATNFKLSSGQSVEFICDYEPEFTVKVSLDEQIIKIKPSDYSNGYTYSILIKHIDYV